MHRVARISKVWAKAGRKKIGLMPREGNANVSNVLSFPRSNVMFMIDKVAVVGKGFVILGRTFTYVVKIFSFSASLMLEKLTN